MKVEVSPLYWPAVVASVLGGLFGIDRFVMGRIGLGVCKLLFGWMTLGLWWLIDFIVVASGYARDSNGDPLIKRY